MAYAPDYLLTEGVQLTSAESGSRMKTAATWLFVLPLFTEGVLPGVVKLQMAGLAVLAFGRIAVVGRERSLRVHLSESTWSSPRWR